jgi:hypothetical protein
MKLGSVKTRREPGIETMERLEKLCISGELTYPNVRAKSSAVARGTKAQGVWKAVYLSPTLPDWGVSAV